MSAERAMPDQTALPTIDLEEEGRLCLFAEEDPATETGRMIIRLEEEQMEHVRNAKH